MRAIKALMLLQTRTQYRPSWRQALLTVWIQRNEVNLFIQRGIQASCGEIELLVEQRQTVDVPRIMQCIYDGEHGLCDAQGTQKDEIQEFAAVIIYNM
jgi:hypothetical protein